MATLTPSPTADASPSGSTNLLTGEYKTVPASAVVALAIAPSINAQTGTSYTAVLTDRIVTMDNASANTFTVPPDADVAFPVGWPLEVWQKGAGQTTIAAGSGVTILKPASKTAKLTEQNSGCSLRKVATNTWRLIGDLEAA